MWLSPSALGLPSAVFGDTLIGLGLAKSPPSLDWDVASLWLGALGWWSWVCGAAVVGSLSWLAVVVALLRRALLLRCDVWWSPLLCSAIAELPQTSFERGCKA